MEELIQELSLDKIFARIFIYWKPNADTDFEHPICFFLVLIIKVICIHSLIFSDIVNFEKQNISITWHKTEMSTIKSTFLKYGQKAH